MVPNMKKNVVLGLLLFCNHGLAQTPDFDRLKEILGRGAQSAQQAAGLRNALKVEELNCQNPSAGLELVGSFEPWPIGLPVGMSPMGGLIIEGSGEWSFTDFKVYGVAGGQAWLGLSYAIPMTIMFQCQASPWWTEEFRFDLRWRAIPLIAFSGPITPVPSGEPDSVGVPLGIRWRGELAAEIKFQVAACRLFTRNGEVVRECQYR